MQIKTIIIALASVVVGTSAFKFTEDVADGVYAILKDDNGVEYAKFIEPLNTTAPILARADVDKRSAKLDRRDQWGCEGRTLDARDTDDAVRGLQNYCSNGNRYKAAKMTFIAGGVQAYTCDYNGGQLCFASEDEHANTIITNGCGRYGAGWRLEAQKTYGYDNKLLFYQTSRP